MVSPTENDHYSNTGFDNRTVEQNNFSKNPSSADFFNVREILGFSADTDPSHVKRALTDLVHARQRPAYEKAEEASMNNTGGMGVKTGTSALGFPKFIQKTDQTRVQNITNLYSKAVADGEEFEESFKLDGSSLTAFVRDGVAGVASRNVGFRMEDEKRGFLSTLSRFVSHLRSRGLRTAKWERVIKKDDNAFTQMAVEAGLIEAIRRDGRNLAIQGEMCGPSIQKNFEGLDKNTFFTYDVFLIDEQRYMLPAERIKFCTDQGVKHVPVNTTGPLKAATVAEVLVRADGPSGLKGKFREGFVYKSTKRDFSFKAISNAYLLKEE
jgi:RNA ligase (TIGR02306 family)